MRLQEFKPGCGAGSIANALLAMGEHQFQEVIWTVAGGSSDGLAPGRLLSGLDTLGYLGRELGFRVPGSALRALRRLLGAGTPVILCVDDWEHWVTAIGVLGERFLVADPADAEIVLSLSEGDLTRRWFRKTKRPVKQPFYGIAVQRRDP
jgi:hypothetical protein